METTNQNISAGSVADVTTDREALPKRWYVAQVRSCCENKTASRIAAMGIETFVPTQTEYRQWSDRKKKVERLLIPLMVFFKADDKEAKDVEHLSYVYTLLKPPGQKTPAIIPDNQIDRFKFMLGNADTPVTVESNAIAKGDPVKVIRGHLKGLEGYIKSNPDGKSKIFIVIDFLGCANVEISMLDISK